MNRIIVTCLCLSLASGLVLPVSGAEKDGKVSADLRLASRVPLNAPIRDFRLPQYTPKGKLSSIIEVDELRRVSDTRFALEGVTIRLFENEKEVRKITTPRARFHLGLGLLAGDHLVRVERVDEPLLEAMGQGFVYELDTQIWSLLREVTAQFRVRKNDLDAISKDPPQSEKP